METDIYNFSVGNGVSIDPPMDELNVNPAGGKAERRREPNPKQPWK